MEDKIKNNLCHFTKVDGVFYHDLLQSGYVVITDDHISSIVLFVLSGIVDITAIRYLKDNQYRINFISK